jgi:hypothetical protein
VSPDSSGPGFQTPLQVESIDATTWVLLAPLVWVGTQGDTFAVDAGEETDFATVPWWTQSLLPRTGTWTRAAVLHDKMCRDLNRYYRGRLDHWLSDPDTVWADTTAWGMGKPAFSSIDTDAVFRKNARDCGTDAIRSELLWLGVRYGALANPARREGWLSTAPRVLMDTVLALLALFVIIAGISWTWPW